MMAQKKEISEKNKKICELYECRYFYTINSGSSNSRNIGVKNANGAYIAFCDDDDIWVKNKLSKQVEIFEKYPETFIVTGDIEYITQTGDKTGKVKSHYGHNHGRIFSNLLLKNRTSTIVPLIRREVFDVLGYFNTNFTIAEDWEFWRRVSYYYPFYALNEVLAYVRQHDSNVSLTKLNSPIERILLYDKLTNSLLLWGQKRFCKNDILLIHKTQWLYYRTILTNHFPGLFKKLGFTIYLAKHNIKAAYHLILLALRFEIFK